MTLGVPDLDRPLGLGRHLRLGTRRAAINCSV
jgi:hypothetical protein